MKINKWEVYYRCQYIEQFCKETGLTEGPARAWMRYHGLPYLLNEWFVNAPQYEKELIREVVGTITHIRNKRPNEKVTFSGISNILEELACGGGMA